MLNRFIEILEKKICQAYKDETVSDIFQCELKHNQHHSHNQGSSIHHLQILPAPSQSTSPCVASLEQEISSPTSLDIFYYAHQHNQHHFRIHGSSLHQNLLLKSHRAYKHHRICTSSFLHLPNNIASLEHDHSCHRTRKFAFFRSIIFKWNSWITIYK